MSTRQELLKQFSVNYWKYREEYYKTQDEINKSYLLGAVHVMKYILTKLESRQEIDPRTVKYAPIF